MRNKIVHSHATLTSLLINSDSYELKSEMQVIDVEIGGYCLMPNQIHLIPVPETKDGLNWAMIYRDIIPFSLK